MCFLLQRLWPGVLTKVITKYQKFNDYGQKYAEKATLLLLNIEFKRVTLDKKVSTTNLQYDSDDCFTLAASNVNNNSTQFQFTRVAREWRKLLGNLHCHLPFEVPTKIKCLDSRNLSFLVKICRPSRFCILLRFCDRGPENMFITKRPDNTS